MEQCRLLLHAITAQQIAVATVGCSISVELCCQTRGLNTYHNSLLGIGTAIIAGLCVSCLELASMIFLGDMFHLSLMSRQPVTCCVLTLSY